MVYKINKKTLCPEKVDNKIIIYAVLVILFLGGIFSYLGYRMGRNNRFNLAEEEKLIIIQEHNQFSQDKLIDKLKELNVKFPWIILAQSIHETNNYTSKIFKECNNLFGMKEAKQRITTSKGTENNHAYYHTWYESVLDYSFYQCRYLSNLNTEEQYFEYLRQSYAEDKDYISKVKNIIKKKQLKQKFINN